MTKLNLTWAEKYRPTNINEFIADESFKNTIKSYIQTNNIPHLLFYNETPGVGKTTLAKILVNTLTCDKKYVNASDNNGIDFVRTEIKPFAMNSGYNPLKIVVLDEADYTSEEFQAALRNIMESTCKTTRFILTCNNISKIIEPIQSRCQMFKLEAPNPTAIAKHIKNILKLENIKYNPNDLVKILSISYPDIRKTLNELERTSTTGTIIINDKNINLQDASKSIINVLKNEHRSFTAFDKIRQIIVDNQIYIFTDMFKMLYDNINIYGQDKINNIIKIIAKYDMNSHKVTNKDIQFFACIIEIIDVLNKKTIL